MTMRGVGGGWGRDFHVQLTAEWLGAAVGWCSRMGLGWDGLGRVGGGAKVTSR